MDQKISNSYSIQTTSKGSKSVRPTCAVQNDFYAAWACLCAREPTETILRTRIRCYTHRWSSNSAQRQPIYQRFSTVHRSLSITFGSMVRSMSFQSMWSSQEQSCSRISLNYEISRQTFSKGTLRMKIKHKCPLIRIFYSRLSLVASSKCLNASMSCGQSMNRSTYVSS